MTLSVFSWNEIQGEPQAGRQAAPSPRGPPWTLVGLLLPWLSGLSVPGVQEQGHPCLPEASGEANPRKNSLGPAGRQRLPQSLISAVARSCIPRPCRAWWVSWGGSRPPGDPRSTPPLRTLCHGHCWPPARGPTLLGAWSTQCLRLDGGSGEGAGPSHLLLPSLLLGRPSSSRQPHSGATTPQPQARRPTWSPQPS